MVMMKDVGLIEVRVMMGNVIYMNGVVMVFKWVGYEFFDGIWKKEVWEKVKLMVKSRGFEFIFDVIKVVMKFFVEVVFKNIM